MYSDVVRVWLIVFSMVSITTQAIWMISCRSGSRPVHSRSVTHQYLAFVGLYVTNCKVHQIRFHWIENSDLLVVTFYLVLAFVDNDANA